MAETSSAIAVDRGLLVLGPRGHSHVNRGQLVECRPWRCHPVLQAGDLVVSGDAGVEALRKVDHGRTELGGLRVGAHGALRDDSCRTSAYRAWFFTSHWLACRCIRRSLAALSGPVRVDPNCRDASGSSLPFAVMWPTKISRDYRFVLLSRIGDA